MKNIRVIPTSSPSKIFYIAENFHLEKSQLIEPKSYHNVYITSDEEIKEGELKKGDWYYSPIHNKIFQCIHNNEVFELERKIILTTDQDLIADSVQAIDDEFLEWFVENPSCEEVEVQKWFDGLDFLEYKIIIPQEEPKQETLEEAAKKRYIEGVYVINGIDICNASKECFIEGAKWQAERMYSEEEVIELLYKRDLYLLNRDEEVELELPNEWFEQFKKK
jgi:hypothetical protein